MRLFSWCVRWCVALCLGFMPMITWGEVTLKQRPTAAAATQSKSKAKPQIKKKKKPAAITKLSSKKKKQKKNSKKPTKFQQSLAQARSSKKPKAPTLLAGTNRSFRTKAYCVMHAQTGELLLESNAHNPIPPASLTKMLTIYMAFERLTRGQMRMDDLIIVTPNAAGKRPSKIGLTCGQKVQVRDALMATIVKSANDAAAALGDHMGGSEDKFAAMMNAKARQLGMHSSNFVNASGWHHKALKSTAYDMAILSLALMRDFPTYYSLFKTRNYKYRSMAYTSTNRLLGKYEGLDGIKTGFTPQAGFNLATSAERGGQRLIVVYMGADTPTERSSNIVRLLDAGFEKLSSYSRNASPQRAAGVPISDLHLKKKPPHLY